jgi:hypothetical protein
MLNLAAKKARYSVGLGTMDSEGLGSEVVSLYQLGGLGAL